jgi:RNA polymerase sigma-70 factor (ECF subfamily)
MTIPETNSAGEPADLLERAGQGDPEALGQLFARYRDRLHRMVRLRMDVRMQGRLDASDVLQEAYVEMAESLADYLRNPAMPFFLWLRTLTGRKLQALHRQHLGTRMRDASREVSLYRGPFPQASSVSLAAHLLGRLTSPSQAAIKAELRIRVQEALNAMDALDREVLALRHFEQMTNAEIARVLDISETAASNRFVRALKRLKEILMEVPGYFDPPPKDRQRPR